MSTAALDLVLAESAPAAEDIRVLRFTRADGAPLPGFSPGAHLVLWGRRMDGAPAARAYSLVGDPRERAAYAIAVLRQGRDGVSAWLHALAPGMPVQAEAPRNDFALIPAARDHLLIAGGIGITPILAMARDLAARGADFTLHYAARSPERMAFRPDLRGIAGTRLTTWLGSAGERLDIPAAIGPWRAGRHLYVCGPRGMIAAARAAALAQGWPSGAIHAEAFGAIRGVAERGFTVELAQSRRSIEVGPQESILDRLLAAGVAPGFDCRRGECGACLTRVLAGTPDHRDTCLTEAERAAGEFMAVCVSRSNGERLVLDL